MIRIHEIHEQLSSSLGDIVYCNNTNIPDGARYTKALRDSYLQRSILETYRRIISQAIGIPRQNVVALLQSLFPHQTFSTTIIPQQLNDSNGNPLPNEYWGSVPKMIYVYNGSLHTQNLYTPNKPNGRILIKVVPEAKVQAMVSGTHTHIPDLCMCVTESALTYANTTMQNTSELFTVIRFYDLNNEIVANSRITVYGLLLPRTLSTAVPVNAIPSSNWNYDSYVQIEDYMVQSIISMATLYAMNDSQELQQTEMFLSNQIINLGRQ